MKLLSLIVFFCLLTSVCFAQADSSAHSGDSSRKQPVKSYFSGSLTYLTNSIYNGRKDSLSTPYLTPLIGYYHKSGFFMDASLSYLTRAGSNRVDLFDIEAGYDFNIGNFDGEVTAGKSFYNSNSTNVAAEIKGSIYFSGGYDFTFVKPTFEGGIDFSNASDYMMGFGLEHSFYADSEHFTITPGVEANGSTQNYYGSYYNKRKLGGKKKNGGITNEVTASVEDASKFKVLDYTFTLPMSYRLNKFTFLLSPAYVIPVHPALVNTILKPSGGGTTINRTIAETLSNSFYCSFGINYKF